MNRAEEMDLINDFLEARRKNQIKLGALKYEDQYNPEMLLALKKMAENGVWPDGRFYDMDVSVWEMFKF